MVISNVATVKKACRSRLADPRSWRGVTAASTTTRSSAMARSARVSIGSALPGPSRLADGRSGRSVRRGPALFGRQLPCESL